MNFITWLKEKFGSSPVPLSESSLTAYADEYALTVGEVYALEMAFWSATNLIANAISKCEFRTFEKGKEVKNGNYYLWNVEPNKNQNSSEFLHKLIAKLYRDNEALVIEQGGNMLVADSFTRKPYVLYEDVFTQVTVGDFTFGQSFSQSQVLHFKLCEQDMRKLTECIYSSYAKLISYTMESYQKSRGTKVVFNYDTLPVTGTPQREAFDSLVNEKISKWLKSDNAALPLGAGQSLGEQAQKTYSNENTRDIRAMIDDISDFTAKAFGIPPTLLRGDVQGVADALDNFLTFCIDPLVDMMQEEINRKQYGKNVYLSGTYLKIDTKQIKHVDLLSVSTAIDKLIGSGVFCVNDILALVGEQAIDEPWAWEHWLTKNYDSITEAMKQMKGGEI